MMCEQLGTSPKLEEIPADYNDFPHIVQIAINIFAMLPDRWEGMSGTYLGKDYSILEYLATVYEVTNHAQLLQFIHMIANIVMIQRSNEQKRQQLKNKRKTK